MCWATMIEQCSGGLQEGPQWWACAQADCMKGRNSRAVPRQAARRAAMVQLCSGRPQEGPQW